MLNIVSKSRARLGRAARFMGLMPPREGDGLKPGVVMKIEPEARVIREEPVTHFLWLDRPSAGRDIKRKLKRGEITAGEADLLRFWAENGYMVIPQCVEPARIDAALGDVDRMWNEKWHVSIDLLAPVYERTFVNKAPPESRLAPHKLNHLDKHSEAVRAIFLHQRIIRMISLIFQNEVVGVNTLTFQFGSQQTMHVDHVYMTPSPPRRMVAAWVALEDVKPDSGPLELWPKSHQLPPFRWDTSYPYHYKPDEQPLHEQFLMSQQHRFRNERFMAKKGDVLLWHSLLAHGGSHIDNLTQTRFSMACHYFSKECFGENVAELVQHPGVWTTRAGMDDPD